MRRGELCGSVQPTKSVRSQERDRTHVPGQEQSFTTSRFRAESRPIWPAADVSSAYTPARNRLNSSPYWAAPTSLSWLP